MAISEYERQREENIARNQKLLEELGLDKPIFEPVESKRPVKAKRTDKKRKVDDTDATPDAPKRVKSSEMPEGGVRRSGRNIGKSIDYKNEVVRTPMVSAAVKSGIKSVENEGPMGREEGKRVHNPKTFGSIPGIEVGTWWETRAGCSTDAIHAAWVGGICGGPGGAYSVALSGGYADDIDLGYAFTYTGSGGRDLRGTKANPKNLRTAPQDSDQTFENRVGPLYYISFLKSSETRKPVRVIRGYKLKSKYAPSEGYRYDGLYVVEKAWMERGLQGFLVCKYAFKRLPNQPPLPVRSQASQDTAPTSDDAEASEPASDHE
ncbi:hypothetical protein EYR40_004029 [Pleurotus pulmonarius]|nr:hypothetical protein EYR40_004029 [Pleurotus pulmonarius]KAF4606735.1 hypothetical protein EYR38_000789 [Pleurotus pulmonarius]